MHELIKSYFENKTKNKTFSSQMLNDEDYFFPNSAQTQASHYTHWLGYFKHGLGTHSMGSGRYIDLYFHFRPLKYIFMLTFLFPKKPENLTPKVDCCIKLNS